MTDDVGGGYRARGATRLARPLVGRPAIVGAVAGQQGFLPCRHDHVDGDPMVGEGSSVVATSSGAASRQSRVYENDYLRASTSRDGRIREAWEQTDTGVGLDLFTLTVDSAVLNATPRSGSTTSAAASTLCCQNGNRSD